MLEAGYVEYDVLESLPSPPVDVNANTGIKENLDQTIHHVTLDRKAARAVDQQSYREPTLTDRWTAHIEAKALISDWLSQHELSNPAARTARTKKTITSSASSVLESKRRESVGHRLWSPFWLRKPVLLASAGLFTSLWVSLLILWHFATNQNGLALTLSHNQYAWTYGPTIILVVVLSFWRQVDYYCKLTQPWRQMRIGPTSASHTVLLDYLSPLQMSSFLRAIRTRHYPVVASIFGFVTLKLVIVVSTGLLVSLSTHMSDDVPVTLSTTFDGADFWRNIGAYTSSGQVQTYENVSDGPVLAYNGVLDGEPWPAGTQNNVAFQLFGAPISTSNTASIAARIDAFVPNVTCETANATPVGSHPAYIQLDSASCSVGHQNVVGINGTTFNQSLLYVYLSVAQPSFDILRVNCSDKGDSGSGYLTDSAAHDFRWALLLSNFTEENVTTSEGGNSNSSKVATVWQAASAVICKIDYGLEKASLTHDQSTDQYNVIVDDPHFPGEYLPQLTRLQLSELVLASLSQLDSSGYSSIDLSLLVDMMKKTLGNSGPYEQFFDADLMANAASQVFAGIAVQLIQQSFLIQGFSNTTGSRNYTEHRLHLRYASLWAMVAGFVLLSILSLVVSLTASKGVVSQDPGSIASHAALFTSSPSLQPLLSGVNDSRSGDLRERLAGIGFRTQTNDSFGILTDGGTLHARNMSSPMPTHKKIWTPYIGRRRAIGLTLCLPILAVVTLEVLYQYSKHNEGLFQVQDDSSVVSYAIRYATALVVVLIATLFNSLDFAVAVITPFSTLRSGTVSAHQGLLSNLLGKLPPLALYKSLCNRQFGAALANSAGLVGSVLTVIASGLWVVDSLVVTQTNVTANLASTWDLEWTTSEQDDGGAASKLNQVVHGGFANPPTIWNDLVLPNLNVVFESDVVNSTLGQRNYTLSIPALRPVLSCDIVPPERLDIYSSASFSGVSISATADLPRTCFEGPGGEQGYVSFSSNFLTRPLSWSGTFTDFLVGPNNTHISGRNQARGESYSATSIPQPDGRDGCPSVVVFFGYHDTAYTSSDNVTTLVCYQKIQQVQANVTFFGSLAATSIVSPVVPDERTAKYLTNGTDGIHSFNYRVADHFRSGFTAFKVADTFQNADTTSLDIFFNHLVYGPNGTALTDLLGPRHLQTFMDAVTRLYNQYMAYVIDLHLRTATAEGDALDGTASFHTPRLKVNHGSKLTLQIMLGIMFVLGAGAYMLTDLRCTLPREPCSIASTMALFADSELCGLMPEGAEWMDERQLAKLLDGWFFSLGWWEQPRRRFGIDVGTAAVSSYSQKRGWAGIRKRRRESSLT